MREKNGKYYAVGGAKGYRWLEAEMVKTLGKEADIDRSYYDETVNGAVDAIGEYGDFERFISDDLYSSLKDKPVLTIPCGDNKYATCFDCPNLEEDKFHMRCGLGYDLADSVAPKAENK